MLIPIIRCVTILFLGDLRILLILSSGNMGSVGTSGSVPKTWQINAVTHSNTVSDKPAVEGGESNFTAGSEHGNSSCKTSKKKILTFTVCYAEPVQNLNVIHSDVSPTLCFHKTFNHHLKKQQKITFHPFWVFIFFHPHNRKLSSLWQQNRWNSPLKLYYTW